MKSASTNKENVIANFSSRKERRIQPKAGPPLAENSATTKHRPPHINQTANPYFLTGRTYFGLPYFDTDEKKELALLRAIKLACQKYHLALDGWVILDNHYHLLFRPPGCTWELGIADKSAISNKRNSDFSRDAIENFRIGKIAGTIHGKSSSLLKEIAGKPASSKKVRNSDFSRDRGIAGKPATADAAWWSAKYWEEIKHRNIALYGNRSQLAEEKRAKEFQRLLNGIADKSATPSELANFVKKIDKVWYQYTDHVIRNEGDYFRHLNYIHQNPVKHGYTEDMAKYRFSSYNRYLKEKGKKWLADCFARYPIVDFMPEGIGED